MTNRKKLLKEIRDAARRRGLVFEKDSRKGGNHEIWKLDGLAIPIPRHREIAEITAGMIRKEAQPKLGKEWWK